MAVPVESTTTTINRMSGAARLAGRVLAASLAAAAVLVMATLGVAPKFGYRTQVIETGSMAPAAAPGTVVLMKPVPAAAVGVGDIILIENEDADRPAMPVIHRVIRKDATGSPILVWTKGDANLTADPTPYAIDGSAFTPVVMIPRLGFAFHAITTPLGWISLVAIPSTLLLAFALVRLWDAPPKPRKSPKRHRSGRSARRVATIMAAAVVAVVASYASPEPVLARFNSTGTVAANAFTTAATFACAVRTPVFMVGMEGGGTTQSWGVFTGGSLTGGTVVTDSVAPRTGTYALRIDQNAAGTTFAERTLPAGEPVVVARFGIYLNSLPTASVSRLTTITPVGGSAINLGYDSGTQRLHLAFTDRTPVAASSAVVAGAWYVIDVRVDFGANPRVADWRIGGVAQAATSSTETASTSSSFRAGSSVTTDRFSARYDDIIISQTRGDYPFPSGGIRRLLPNAMSTSVGATNLQNDNSTAIDSSTYLRLDDIPLESSADFVKQVTASSTSHVGVALDDVPIGAGCINGVSGGVTMHSSATGANAAKTSVFSGSTETVVHSGSMGTSSVAMRSAIINPTTAPWSKAQLDATVFRLGYATDVNPVPYWDAVMVEYDAG